MVDMIGVGDCYYGVYVLVVVRGEKLLDCVVYVIVVVVFFVIVEGGCSGFLIDVVCWDIMCLVVVLIIVKCF